MLELGPEQWGEVRRLFGAALELPAEERTGFIDRIEDQTVRQEVSSLLKHLEAGETMGDAPHHGADEQRIGTRVGPYRIESILGHGGMGAVYRAARDDGEFQQVVAIKLVRAAAQSPETMQRFRQERQILARLSHPNIARLLDGGSTDQGVPYLVMEFIAGEPITEWCRQHELGIDERLRLWIDVCSAVDYANKHAVVHRDLKPGNILVTAEGVPKLLDFGIAKMVSDEGPNEGRTVGGLRVMTPEYAAPEQVLGEPVTVSADVYALGLCLYELLTGRKAQDIGDFSPSTVERVVCREEPPPPAKVRPDLSGDLDNIIRMAIRKEPGRRYASAADLARDIRLHLGGRPVRARPDTVRYRAGKFLRRNRLAVVGALGATLVFASLAVALRFGAPRLPRVSAVNQLTQTGQVAGNGLATDGKFVYCVLRSLGVFTLAKVPAAGGVPQPLRSEIEGVELLDISPDRTNLLITTGHRDETPLLVVSTAGQLVRRIGNIEAVGAGWGPDSQSIVFSRGNSLFKAAIDGSGIRKLLAFPGSPVQIRCLSGPRGGVIRFLARADDFSRPRIWEVNGDGTGLHILFSRLNADSRMPAAQDSGSWFAGGKYYLFRSASDTYRLLAVQDHGGFLGLANGRPMLIHSSTSGIYWPVPSPDGKRVYYVSGLERREFLRFDRKRREFVPFLPGIAGRWAAFSRDGRWLAYTVAPQEALWISRADGSEPRQIDTGEVLASEPDWSPSGDSVVFTGRVPGRSVGVYRVAFSGGPITRLSPEGFIARYPSWSPDGKALLFRLTAPSGHPGSGLYLMDVNTRKISMLPESEELVAGSWSPKGRYIAATDRSKLRLFDSRSGRWNTLGTSAGYTNPFWSENGTYMFVQDFLSPEQPIWRVAIGGGPHERFASSRQIPQSDLTSYVLSGVAPGDTPVATVIRKNMDVYALEVEMP
ncbi:MAG: protein kinase [Bryobacteraceae bacterium]|jgi:serine/threonine-protein kinase